MKAKEQDLDKLSTLKDVKDKLPPFTSFEGNGEKGETADIVSKKVGISRGTYERGKKIIEKGSEEVKEKLRKGQSTIYKEYNKIKKNQKREELLLQSTKKPKIGFLPSQEENCKLFCGDFQDYINSSDKEMIQDESVDLIFTDIEYLKKSLPLCRGLFFLATKKLKKRRNSYDLYRAICTSRDFQIFRGDFFKRRRPRTTINILVDKLYKT
ncbi:MAG: hypothetical protein ACM3VV_00080 [Deltaproteobacteria bacterium]